MKLKEVQKGFEMAFNEKMEQAIQVSTKQKYLLQGKLVLPKYSKMVNQELIQHI